MITIRFNFRRYVASFDTLNDLNNWLRGSDLYQGFMYTIHGHNGETNLEKYKKSLVVSK